MGRSRLPGCRSRGDLGDLMQLESGMRVRCVDNVGGFGEALRLGAEYRVLRVEGELVAVHEMKSYTFVRSRFKPVVRVKARSLHTGKAFDALLERAVATRNAMSIEQQQATQNAQRESWVRGQVGWD